MGARMDRAAIFETILVLLLILLGCALFIGISAGPTGSGGNWSTSSVNATPYMFAGSGDKLYIFNVLWDDTHQGDTDIKVLSPEGNMLWSYAVSMPWSAVNQWERNPVARQYTEWGSPQPVSVIESSLVFATDKDTLYLYLRNVGTAATGVSKEKVIAIRDGHAIWERPLSGDVARSGSLADASLEVVGDRLYAYRSYSLSVFGTNGTLLFDIGNVSDPPSVDPEGNVYVTEVTDGPEVLTVNDYNVGPQSMKIPMPSNQIASYSPNGTRRWEASINGTPTRQVVDRKAVPDGCDLPLYNDGRLYVPLEHGMAALDTDGKALWNVSIDDNVSLLATMPFGPDGTAYMVPDSKQGYWMSKAGVFYAINPDGNVSVIKTEGLDLYLMAVSQGTGYYGQSWGQEDSTQDVGSLLDVNITALDLREGSIRWNLTIAPAKITTVVADRQNVLRLFPAQNQGYNSIFYTEDHPELLDRIDLIYLVEKSSWVNVLAGGNVVYVGYYLLSYEYPEGYGNGYAYTSLHNSLYSPYGYPALLGRSRICYASGVAALDVDGNILWNRPLDSMLTSMAAGNRTFYFGTQDGGLSAVRSEVAVGFTLTAALYLFFRFFLVGAVSRARSRINDNENRNRVLKLIKAQPGNTMYEIARLLAMNAGTVRYHLLILGLNHRIATFRDGKYVRYFGNSGAYTEEERAIIALLRRDWARGLLAALLERDGMSNVELSRALGVTEPAVSGYMRELAGKGIVIRDVSSGGSILYSIRGDYKEKLARVLKTYPASAGI